MIFISKQPFNLLLNNIGNTINHGQLHHTLQQVTNECMQHQMHKKSFA
jgi:hypothetical protein